MSERPKIILVYQMGKVGSQSIAHALMTAGFRERTVADSTDVGPLRDCVIHIHHHDQVAAFLAKTQSEIKFVTGMRRIIDRNIAAFFSQLPQRGQPLLVFRSTTGSSGYAGGGAN